MYTMFRKVLWLIMASTCVTLLTLYQRRCPEFVLKEGSAVTRSLHARDENYQDSSYHEVPITTDKEFDERPAKILEEPRNNRAHECSFDNNSTYTSWLKTQRERKEVLNSTCKSYGQETKSRDDEIEAVLKNERLLDSLWVSEHDHVIYCPIGKVSCSSWRVFFMQLFDGPNYSIGKRHDPHNFIELAEHGMKQLKEYSQDEIVHMLQRYPRFITVRHPYSRLHSAYIDKFTPQRNGHWNPLYPEWYGTRIIRRYWKNPSEESLRTGRNITFEDFLHYLSDKNVTQDKLNFHWIPFHTRCSPCEFRYDYVLKLETMSDDTEHFLRCVLNTTRVFQKQHFAGHTDLSAYESIPKEYMENLWEAYGRDFRLFGYTPPNIST